MNCYDLVVFIITKKEEILSSGQWLLIKMWGSYFSCTLVLTKSNIQLQMEYLHKLVNMRLEASISNG